MSGRSSSKLRSIIFSGHPSHIVGIARSCREEKQFTDVVIHCSNGVVHAHRLVLASCSSFMSGIFLNLPEGLGEYTVIIPNMRREIVEKLINFLYTGEMTLARSNTCELQQLVHILQIDPENVRIDLMEEESPPEKAHKQIPSSKKKAVSSGQRGGVKRSASSDSFHSAPNKIIIRGQARTRGRPPKNAGITRSFSISNSASNDQKTKGLHDMMNVDTWVCAICGQFDPNVSGGEKTTTEWIGCDCNRWYHQDCTKLKVLDRNFSCTKVNLKCLTS